MQRYLTPYIIQDLQKKMVFIGGPRQVGKTTESKRPLQNESAPAWIYIDLPLNKSFLLREAAALAALNSKNVCSAKKRNKYSLPLNNSLIINLYSSFIVSHKEDKHDHKDNFNRIFFKPLQCYCLGPRSLWQHSGLFN